MKLEKDHMLGIQSPPHKSYNPFDSDDEIEATNGYVKSSLNGYDIKCFETNADSITFYLDNSDDVSWEEAILGHSQILRQSTPGDSNGEELPRKDTELFTDKTVTKCDLPELMVCYKENAYHSVKDIGIDEGIKSRDKNESENSTALLGFDGDINEGEPVKLSFMEGLKSRSGNDLDKDISYEKLPQDSMKDSGQDNEILERQQIGDHCGINDTTNLGELKLNSSSEKSNFSIKSTVDQINSGREYVSSTDQQLDDKTDSRCHETEGKEDMVSEEHRENTLALENPHQSSTMTSTTDISEASTESNESVYEEATTSLSPEHSEPLESSESGGADVLSYNSKVESGSIILDFNSTAVAAKDEEEEEISQHIKTVAKPPESQLMSRIDEGSILDTGTENRVHGETSFSAAMPPPASITYMGPFGHNGNISLRSESSCGSTRSFAFPVLQAEWNSSPVRMAKAEQRNRKQKWVHSVMCCR